MFPARRLALRLLQALAFYAGVHDGNIALSLLMFFKSNTKNSNLKGHTNHFNFQQNPCVTSLKKYKKPDHYNERYTYVTYYDVHYSNRRF